MSAVESPRINAFYFMVISLICQSIALSSAIVFWSLIPHTVTTLCIATLCGLAVAHLCRLPFAWKLFNAAMPCSVVFISSVSISSWLLFGITIAAISIFAPALWTRVPFYPTPKASYAAILSDLPVNRPFSFIDVGSGSGELLFVLARNRPNGRFIGVEAGLIPFLYSRLLGKIYRIPNVTIRLQNFWKTDTAQYDWVYTFLSPAAMPHIWKKVKSEMRDGTTFMTNSFPVPSEASEIIPTMNERCPALYIHRMKLGEEHRA
jgi:hypothetical protein